MSAKLMLHCGCEPATLADLQAAPIPEPTRTWAPIKHLDYVRLIIAELTRRQYTIVEKAFGLSPDGVKFFGVMEVTPMKALTKDPGDFGTALALRNFNDGMHSCMLAMGSHVFVCDNMAFSGELMVSRRHCANRAMDMLREEVEDALGKLVKREREQREVFNQFKHTPLTDMEVSHLLIRCMEKKVYSVSKIEKVLATFRNPPHEEFADPTLWSFHNAVTEVLKGTNTFALPRKTIRLMDECKALLN